MCPSTPPKPSSSGSADIVKTHQVLRRSNDNEASPPSILQNSTEHRVKVAQVSNGGHQEPDIAYLKQPVVMNHTGSAPSYSRTASAKLPDDWQVCNKEQNKARIPNANIDFVERIPDGHSVYQHIAKHNSATENTNGKANFYLHGDGTGEKGDSNMELTTDALSKVITDTTCRYDTITSTIHSASTITASVVTNEGTNINVTVDANRKFTITHRKIPDSNPPRYVVNAPIEVKIIVQDLLPSSDPQNDCV